jgi:hypothetical protein
MYGELKGLVGKLCGRYFGDNGLKAENNIKIVNYINTMLESWNVYRWLRSGSSA